jgi:hypothetical protein
MKSFQKPTYAGKTVPILQYSSILLALGGMLNASSNEK